MLLSNIIHINDVINKRINMVLQISLHISLFLRRLLGHVNFSTLIHSREVFSTFYCFEDRIGYILRSERISI